MTSSLSDEFKNYYDTDLDSLYLDLMVNGEWIPSGVWHDITYIGHCCQPGGMYAISKHYQQKIEQARVRIYPGSGVNGGWGDTTQEALFDLFFSPRELRYLAREHRQGIRYYKPERRINRLNVGTQGYFKLNIRV